MLSDEHIDMIRCHSQIPQATDREYLQLTRADMRVFARSIEAEVRKDDEALIRQMLEALEWEAGSWKTDPERTKSAIAAARARLPDSDLSKLTERGAKAWAGVDPQKLREGGAL